jgi:hypothetical protein
MDWHVLGFSGGDSMVLHQLHEGFPMTTTLPVWTDQDSASLTARLIVMDAAHMSGSGLDELELRATVDLAYRHKVRRAIIAERIGWTQSHLANWCRDRGIHHPEDITFPGLDGNLRRGGRGARRRP